MKWNKKRKDRAEKKELKIRDIEQKKLERTKHKLKKKLPKSKLTSGLKINSKCSQNQDPVLENVISEDPVAEDNILSKDPFLEKTMTNNKETKNIRSFRLFIPLLESNLINVSIEPKKEAQLMFANCLKKKPICM